MPNGEEIQFSEQSKHILNISRNELSPLCKMIEINLELTHPLTHILIFGTSIVLFVFVLWL